ncbi:MAG: type II toxin-antitoxin system RelB/DinJ family antitoxin [Candidatus Buchananbacteria bacterium]
MNTVINFKTEPKVKAQAQKLAAQMGLDLSDVLNVALRNFVQNRIVYINLGEDAKPSPWLVKAVASGRREIKAKKLSPAFGDAKSASKWLKS